MAGTVAFGYCGPRFQAELRVSKQPIFSTAANLSGEAAKKMPGGQSCPAGREHRGGSLPRPPSPEGATGLPVPGSGPGGSGWEPVRLGSRPALPPQRPGLHVRAQDRGPADTLAIHAGPRQILRKRFCDVFTILGRKGSWGSLRLGEPPAEVKF